MNKNTSLGEACGYDHWQLQIIDKVDEGQPGQLGKRSANLCRQITVAENNFNKKTLFLHQLEGRRTGRRNCVRWEARG